MKILLHLCCSNCTTYPVRILREARHQLTGFWFNPNIHPFPEYRARLDSLHSLVEKWRIDLLSPGENRPEEYFRMFGVEDIPGPEAAAGLLAERKELAPALRCTKCYELRLARTAEAAAAQGYDAFSTTLLISPFQNFDQIIAIGKELAQKKGVFFYTEDFRKYYQDSVALSRELGLYRQNYCGCIFSREERTNGRKR